MDFRERNTMEDIIDTIVNQIERTERKVNISICFMCGLWMIATLAYRIQRSQNTSN